MTWTTRRQLLHHQSLAGAVHVFVHTSPYRKQDKHYIASVTVPLVRPTADTRLLASAALAGLRSILREGFRYENAGVMLVELQPDTARQGELDLLDDAAELQFAASRDRTKFMPATEVLNGRYGRGSVQLASNSTAPATRSWSMKQDRRTPRYTTVWEEIAVARA